MMHAGWFEREIVDAGKLPLTLCLITFVLTFVGTRVITRMIRAGIGPFSDNVTDSGLHVHHAVPGLALLIIGAFTSLAAVSPWPTSIAGVLIGVGSSLVLDEFALILHLQDVYWTQQGRASVQVVALATVCLGLVLLGASPLGVADVAENEGAARWIVVASLVLAGICVVVCATKGKYRLIVLAIFIPVVAYVGAVRLARPGSLWFRRYAEGSRKRVRAVRRAQRWDSVNPTLHWLADLIAGAPQDALVVDTRPRASDSDPRDDSATMDR